MSVSDISFNETLLNEKLHKKTFHTKHLWVKNHCVLGLLK